MPVIRRIIEVEGPLKWVRNVVFGLAAIGLAGAWTLDQINGHIDRRVLGATAALAQQVGQQEVQNTEQGRKLDLLICLQVVELADDPAAARKMCLCEHHAPRLGGNVERCTDPVYADNIVRRATMDGGS